VHCDWNDFVGQTIARRLVLNRFIAEGSGTALFTTTHPDLPSGAFIRLTPADATGATAQERSWSLATKLSHPGLLRVPESGRGELDGDEFLYSVSEAPDDSVADVLPKRPLEAEEARQVLESIVPALRYLHDHGAVHGSVTPAAIVAVGETVKLTTDTVYPAVELDNSATVSDIDVRGLGATVVELLTQHRPDAGSVQPDYSVLRSLPSPFREIASGTLQPDAEERWTLEDVERSLAGLPVVPRRSAQVQSFDKGEDIPGLRPAIGPAISAGITLPPGGMQPSAVSRRTGAMVVAGGAVALLVGVLAFRGDHSPAAAPVAEAHVAPASPVHAPPGTVPPPAAPNTAGPKAASPAPSAAHTSATGKAEPPPSARHEARSGENRWAVVAAIYRNHAAATKRAKEIRARSKFETEVLPPEGKGSRYMVVLASGLTRSAAETTLKRARAAGLPHDSYVTKLDPQP